MIWERQSTETARAHEAFKMYLQLGEERSCAKVAQALGKSRTLITRWSSAHDWQARTIEYDRDTERRERESDIKARLAMRRRHATLALLALEKVAEALPKIKADTLVPSAVARLMDAGCRVERMARGSDEEDGGFATVTIVVRRADGNLQRSKGGLAS